MHLPKPLLVIVLVVIAIALTSTTFAALSVNKSLSSLGGINVTANLGVYSDINCTNPISSVIWGNITGGETASQTIYIKNTGSGMGLTLSMSPENWSPSSAGAYMTLAWDREGQRIEPNQVIPAVLTLTTSLSTVDVTSFSVQISITGTQ